VLLGRGHAVRPEDRVRDGIVLLPAKDQSLSEDAFPDGSDFLGHALAGDVFEGGLDLEAVQGRVGEGPVAQESARLCGDAAPAGGCPHPVTEKVPLPGIEPGLRPSQSRVHPPHSRDGREG